jgi:hypothetical protein
MVEHCHHTETMNKYIVYQKDDGHFELKILNDKISLNEKKIITLSKHFYQHYKNKKFYQLIGSTFDPLTEEEVVLYRALYTCPTFGEKCLWIRPKSMFFGTVGDDDRFKKINSHEIEIDSQKCVDSN